MILGLVGSAARAVIRPLLPLLSGAGPMGLQSELLRSTLDSSGWIAKHACFSFALPVRIRGKIDARIAGSFMPPPGCEFQVVSRVNLPPQSRRDCPALPTMVK